MAHSSELMAKARRLHFYEHYSIHAVSKAVHLHRDTVERILYPDRDAPKDSARVSILDPYKEVIHEHLKLYPSIRGTKMLQIMRDRGYKGSVNTLNRYLRPHRKKSKRGFRPMSYIAGEQAQVDWAHFGELNVSGGKRKLYLFVMVLSYSRAIYAEFSFDMKTDSFLRLHERAFVYFGGCSKKLLYDNLKSAVAQRLDNLVQFNPHLSEFAGFYGFEPAVCRPYAGNQKGRVERAIRYIRDNFAGGYLSDLIDERNRALVDWLNQTANKRPWPQQRDKTVWSQWEEEKQFLRTPKSGNKFHATSSVTTKVNKTGLVRFDLNDYSVPINLNREVITIEADDEWVSILHNGLEVCKHMRSWERGQRVMSLDHWRTERSDKKWQHRDLLLQLIPELEEHLRVLISRGESKHTMLRRFLQLYEIYGEHQMREAINLALKQELHHPEQISRLLVETEKSKTPMTNAPVVKDPKSAELHIKSHSLDSYDLL